MFAIKGLFFDKEGDGGGGGSSSSSSKGDGGELTMEAWLETQDEKVKGLLERHTQSLRNALQSERESRKDLEKQVRDLASKAEKGSKTETELTQFAEKLAEADRRADFFDAAHRAGVTSLKLAYQAAVSDDLFDKKGNVDFAKLKAAYPELFGKKQTPNGNAGEGTEQDNAMAVDMNTLIRRRAGRTA